MGIRIVDVKPLNADAPLASYHQPVKTPGRRTTAKQQETNKISL